MAPFSCEADSIRVPGHRECPSRRQRSARFRAAGFAALLLLSALHAAGQVRAPEVPDSTATLVTLTPAERAWLDAHPDIVLGYAEGYEPEVIVDPDGSYRGILVDVLSELNRRLGARVRLEVGPVTPMLDRVQRREIDGALAIHPEHARRRGLSGTRVYFELYPAAFTLRGAAFDEPGDLDGKRVAIVDGVYFAEQLVQKYARRATVLRVRNALEGLRGVSQGEVDVFLGKSTNSFLVTRYQLLGLAERFVFRDDPVPGLMAVRPDWPILATILDKGLASLNKREVESTVAKWVGASLPESVLPSVRYDQGLRWNEVLPWAGSGLAAAALVLGVVLVWNRALKRERNLLERRVQERTAKLQESELLARTGEERARATFEQAAVGMAYVGLDGRFIRINKKFCDIVGYPESELVELKFTDITHPDDLAADAEALTRLARGETGTDSREKRYVHKSGDPVWVERTVALVRTDQGTSPWLITVIQDISARKAAEQAVLDYQRRLRELAAQLSRAEERERRNLAAELHDHVGQSLSAARALLAAARKATADRTVDAALDEVSNSLRQAIRATRDIMSSLSPPALNELGLSAAVSEWLRDAIERGDGLEVEFIDDGQPKPLGADASAILFRAVRELVTNVVKHARAGRVTVAIRRENGSIEVVVEDDGVGMPAGRPPRRGARDGGFGLFSIEERIADIGGRLVLGSASGRGLRATLTAPLVTDEADGPPARSPAAPGV